MKKLVQQKQTTSKRIVKAFNQYSKWLALPLGLLCLVVLSLVLIILTYQDKIFPRIQVNQISLGGLTKDQAKTYLTDLTLDYAKNAQIDLYLSDELKEATISSEEKYKTLDLNNFQLSYHLDETVSQIFEVGRKKTFGENLIDIKNLISAPLNFSVSHSLNSEAVNLLIDSISDELDRPGAKPAVILNQDGSQISDIFMGENGVVVNKSQLFESLNQRARDLSKEPIIVLAEVETNQVTTSEAEETKQRATNLLSKTLVVNFGDKSTSSEQTWEITGSELTGFINFNGGFDSTQINSYLKTLAETINRPAQNAAFEFNNGRVEEFVPAIDGLTVDLDANTNALISALESLESDATSSSKIFELITISTQPEVKTADVNDLGIKELLGRGESTYRGSIAGRVFNVAHTASKIHGVLIPPGETFSFVKTVGEISAATGYKTAYVIQNGRTVLGDGGGVCQDSTTLFRAVMDAGLPIAERKAHSYRVGYYEQNSQPGFDATIYSPTVDFKFTNDTPGHILIQAHADSANTKLVVELYGTSDGRVSEISNYRQWDAVPAPPPLYQDDPTIPSGTVKQVDWAASGLKVKFDYTVKRNEEIIFNQTYYSNYKPWQAVYLKGV